MNEHDIQSELPFHGDRYGDEHLPDAIDIHRGLAGTLHLGLLVFSFLGCLVGAVGSAVVYWFVMIQGQHGGQDGFITFGIWGSSPPYLLMCLPVWYYRHSLFASGFLLPGTFGIAGWGLYILYRDLSPWFEPPDPHEMFSMGPALATELPILQGFAITGFWIAAALLNWLENRKRVNASGAKLV